MKRLIAPFIYRTLAKIPARIGSITLRVVDEAPDHVTENTVYLEIRDGHQKWLHFKCPKCGDHLQMPLAGRERWQISIDFLGRISVYPSIWELNTCGAHFFIRRSKIEWVPETTGFRREARRTAHNR